MVMVAIAVEEVAVRPVEAEAVVAAAVVVVLPRVGGGVRGRRFF